MTWLYNLDIPILKKGGIHIKKKNRGKFTEYCGGKVTEECIAKGKKSKDPKIRKRATFAANARKWKHADGGILKYQNPAITLDLPEGSEYGGELEPAIIKPEPVNAVLRTYYPLLSEYPFTGHSELQLFENHPTRPEIPIYLHLPISKSSRDFDYNLVTNNCSDATRCAVEQIFGEKINPTLFTTPGDVQDFVAEKTGQKPVKEDKGVTSLTFDVPFATAMDLKNKQIDFYIQDYLHKSSEYKKHMKEKNPNWSGNTYDEHVREAIAAYESKKYKFQPFINKTGGILKAQNGTGNIYAPHPLSPIGIALNQAKAMSKTKEKRPQQQYLPPGVKEVIGPDGKKVAIRTEQPLVPLEQSIAEWLPGTGDVAEVGYIANDVKNGNYGSAALAAAMVAMPGNVGKLWRRIDLPGLHLQSTMPGSVFEKTLSKDGFINKKTVEQYLSKPDVSVGEKNILGKIQFPENGKMDYNEFRKAVQNELSSAQYSQNWRSFEIFDKDFTGYENPYFAHGLDRLGYKLETDPGLGTKYDFSPDAIYNRSITYSNPKLIGGDARHFDYNTLGHTRAFISKAEPDVYHVLESQSDFFQRGDPAKRMWFDPDTGVSNIIRSESGDFIPTNNLKYGLSGDSWTTNEWNRLLENRTINQGDVPSQELSYIYKWWPERQLSESVLNASSNGATKLRYPTRDTAAKIEKYELIDVDGKLSYKPEHETILKKICWFS